MMATIAAKSILQNMLSTMEAEGYEVYLKPGKLLLPPFLKGYSPDAIALRADKNIAIAIASKSVDQENKIEKAIAEFKDQPRWELRVVWIEPATQGKTLSVQSEASVSERFAIVRTLIDQGQIEASLLMGWAAFEALARSLFVDHFSQPQTSNRIVQTLASEGYLTPTEADKLRVLAGKRNLVSHGEFQTDVSRDEMEEFLSIIENLQRLPVG